MTRNQTQEQKDNKEQKRKKRWLLLLILLLLLLIKSCVGVGVWNKYFREPDVLTPDYAPQETEPNGEDIIGDDDDKMESPEGGGAVSLTYSTDVTIDLSDEAASLMFANPGKSNHDMVVQLVIQDTVIIQSGRLIPGKMVSKLDLLEDAAKLLVPGGYEGKFVVFYYDPDTGEKALVNTEIPLSITVQE